MTSPTFISLTSYHYAKVVDWLTGLVAHLKGSAVKILLRLAKWTFGYRKWEDKIALSQFETACGLSRETIVTTIEDLLTLRLIRRRRSGNSYIYALNLPGTIFVENSPFAVDNVEENSDGLFHNTGDGASFFTQKSGTSPQNDEQMVGFSDPQIKDVTEGNRWEAKVVELLETLTAINSTLPHRAYPLRNLPRWAKRAITLGMQWSDLWTLWCACERVGRNPVALLIHRLMDDGTPPVGEPLPPPKRTMTTKDYWRLALAEGN
jgi:hypothetical protein